MSLDERTGSERTIVGNYVDITAIGDRFDCGSVSADSADGRKRVVCEIIRHAKAPAASVDPFAIAERRSDMDDQGRSLTWGCRYWGEYKEELANENELIDLLNSETDNHRHRRRRSCSSLLSRIHHHEALRIPSVTKTHCGND